jgi:hypothetical protein
VFAQYDVVALMVPWPAKNLAAGVWGNVLNVLADGFYEVEFIEKDGTPIATSRVQEGSLELIWADPG